MLFFNKYQNQYLKTRPLSFKIFLIIIAIKPIFNTLEEFNVPYLPFTILEIFSSFIFVLLIMGILNNKNKINSGPIIIYQVFFILYFINILFVQIANPSFGVFSVIIKALTPSMILFYCVRVVNNASDLDLIFRSFLVSLIPFALITVIDANSGMFTLTRRDVLRMSTSFGDIVTVGMQINLIYAVILYKYIQDRTWLRKSRNIYLGLFMMFALFLFSKINHAASFAVFTALTVTFIFFRFKNNKVSTLIAMTIFAIPAYLLFGDWMLDFYNNIYFMEYTRILDDAGRIQNTMLLHGRAGRLIILNNLFFDQSTFRIIFGGLGIDSPVVLSSLPHNDFFRILYVTGFLGLTTYLLFILSIIAKVLTKDFNTKYLAALSLSILILYSITTTPSFYIDLNLLLMPVFVYLTK